jgi:micrococcal nuclease
MCVDGEESQIGGTKPFTNAGVRAKHFTREMLTSGELSIQCEIGETEQDQLRLNRDSYQRLLAHIYINDVIHVNDELIRLGFSPYFNKYGNSRLFDSQFREAQTEAQHRGLMIWNPETNRGGAFRDYEKLLPIWERRAAAVDLARYSQIRGEKIWICDNECPYIAGLTARSRNLFINYFYFLLDFQYSFSSVYTKGLVIRQRTQGKLLRFFFSSDFLSDSENSVILQEITDDKDYSFIGGTLHRYRGTDQVTVDAIARTPFDF